MSIPGLTGGHFTVLARPLAIALIAAAGFASRPAAAAPVVDTPIRGSWTRLPLGRWAERITGMTGVPLVVDRRIDHTIPITLESDGLPLAAVLDTVAATAAAEVEVLAGSLHLVPRAAAGRATAGERRRERTLASLPPTERKRLADKAAWDWPAGSRPRELVAGLAAAAGLSLSGLEAIPHDHLPATHLPPLTVAERIDLVLAQYDLRADWHTGGGTVVPLPPAEPGAGPAAARAAMPRSRRTAAGPATERYSMRLEAPLDQAVAALARRFDLQPQIDAESLAARGISAAEIVRVHVEDVERTALLDAVVGPFGLAWAIDGGTLRVFAAPSDDR